MHHITLIENNISKQLRILYRAKTLSLVQSQQQKHQNTKSEKCKHQNDVTSITPFSCVSIVDFKQVHISWVSLYYSFIHTYLNYGSITQASTAKTKLNFTVNKSKSSRSQMFFIFNDTFQKIEQIYPISFSKSNYYVPRTVHQVCGIMSSRLL